VEAHLDHGSSWRADLLIGADGIHSRLAPLLAPLRRLHDGGDRVWRGVVACGEVSARSGRLRRPQRASAPNHGLAPVSLPR
jgi:2-polyprenyl-6-methoxyphenol hydroxylase-like FAD-dependent oxidoreductase